MYQSIKVSKDISNAWLTYLFKSLFREYESLLVSNCVEEKNCVITRKRRYNAVERRAKKGVITPFGKGVMMPF